MDWLDWSVIGRRPSGERWLEQASHDDDQINTHAIGRAPADAPRHVETMRVCRPFRFSGRKRLHCSIRCQRHSVDEAGTKLRIARLCFSARDLVLLPHGFY